MYEYKANVMRVVDGDTVVLDIDLGLSVWQRDEHVRLLGINAPEMRRPTLERGRAAKAFLAEILPVGQEVIINTVKDKSDKYGRYLARIYVEGQSMTVNDLMLSEGHGVPTDDAGHPLGKADPA